MEEGIRHSVFINEKGEDYIEETNFDRYFSIKYCS